MPAKPHLKWERQCLAQGFKLVAGVDEVGRGAWAGPLVAAAVILPLHSRKVYRLGIRDSKSLDHSRREQIFKEIQALALDWHCGLVEVRELNRLGLGTGTRLAMDRALAGLRLRPNFILVDGRTVKFSLCPSRGVIDGDIHSLSIAAASIVAKVTRDRLMMKIGKMKYPAYRFELHKGYGTKLHQQILAELGVSPWHRSAFRPIQLLQQVRLDA